MALMEFLKQNKLQTTTSATVTSGSATAPFLLDRNTMLKYLSSGYTSNTSSLISVVFASPTVLSTIFIQNHNLKQFRAYYNSVTANSLLNVSSNSATSSYFSFASVTVNSVDLQMDSAMTADTERQVGEFVVTERRLQFERNPSAPDFDPQTNMVKVLHKMPDGGVTSFVIRAKYRTNMKWKFISTTFRNSLKTVYDEALPLYFLPFPTTTSWDGIAHEEIWTNAFDFSYDENSKTEGFGGTILLEETSNA